MDPRRRAIVAALAATAIRPAFAQSKPMTKMIPSSGEPLPVIGLGTWQAFDVRGDTTALREVLRVFSQMGGRVIDSSPMYGAAESVVGELTADLKLHDKLFMATKVWTRGRIEGIRQIEASFKRMKLERIDLMQVHNLLDVQTHTETLKELKLRERARYIGITHYTPSGYDEVERWLKTERYDFLQINYSLAEREVEQRILPLCRESGVAVMANRPFAEGALFRKVKGRPLPPWAADLKIESWAQYFLKWIVSHPTITCAIPGTGNPAHMKDNMGAAQGEMLDAATRKRMASYFQAL